MTHLEATLGVALKNKLSCKWALVTLHSEVDQLYFQLSIECSIHSIVQGSSMHNAARSEM